jgi:glutamyl-tRNA synthetase
VHPVVALDQLGPVDLSRLSRAPAKFDEHELWALSAKTLHALPFAAVRQRFASRGLPVGDDAEAFWSVVRGNLQKFEDVDGWWTVVHGVIAPVCEDQAFLDVTARVLPDEPWSSATWAAWTGQVKVETGVKGRSLFHPLRLALTARETGPELAGLLPLIGRAKALARLSGRAA